MAATIVRTHLFVSFMFIVASGCTADVEILTEDIAPPKSQNHEIPRIDR